MYERLEICPSCKNTKFDNFLICKDYTVSGESFALVKCSKCELILTNPRPAKDSIGQFYKSDNYISHTNKGNSIVNMIYKNVRQISIRNKYSLIKQLGNHHSFLDYGCGTGHFINFLKSKGKKVYGVEPNEDARNTARSITKMDLHESIDDIKETFDIITAWHVIEHVHDLKQTVKTLKKRLNKNGYLIIAVPNINSYDSKFYKEYWAAIDVPRHLYHFSRTSMENLSTKLKLKIKRIMPLKFDSYYVSMLSEKYKHGHYNYLNALINGFKSNRLAKKNGEYSSLIYVMKK